MTCIIQQWYHCMWIHQDLLRCLDRYPTLYPMDIHMTDRRIYHCHCLPAFLQVGLMGLSPITKILCVPYVLEHIEPYHWSNWEEYPSFYWDQRSMCHQGQLGRALRQPFLLDSCSRAQQSLQCREFPVYVMQVTFWNACITFVSIGIPTTINGLGSASYVYFTPSTTEVITEGHKIPEHSRSILRLTPLL